MSESNRRGVAFQATVYAGLTELAAAKTKQVRAEAGIPPDVDEGPKVTFNYLVNQACRELLRREEGAG